ncbi:MAG: hypothetical protein K6E30_10975 [Lachnospiraceae bacterium]|nr:hypothetical protein [Lachnospiraceae bacterium]
MKMRNIVTWAMLKVMVWKGRAALRRMDEHSADAMKNNEELLMKVLEFTDQYVLIVEALTRAFGERFWDFIREGGYWHRAKSSGAPQFYRFDKPQQEGVPQMIEQHRIPGQKLKALAFCRDISHAIRIAQAMETEVLDDLYFDFRLFG